MTAGDLTGRSVTAAGDRHWSPVVGSAVGSAASLIGSAMTRPHPTAAGAAAAAGGHIPLAVLQPGGHSSQPAACERHAPLTAARPTRAGPLTVPREVCPGPLTVPRGCGQGAADPGVA